MRTTLIIKEELMKTAQEMTGITEKTALVHRGLELLIQEEAAKRLVKLGGSDPGAKAAPRKRLSKR